ncbi:flagellar hook-length control protein FliK [Endozoicomonas sp. SCSIO W0465]|uniref:flagellar hook-length control protein FliK n=1 Tax=Endozoicomonas sp. SCSIO W0465 TaxID=2918516 RepID=UPI00207529B0|nr:flagellar hook-length control protein FliK [Endozoicomonas sp. SCSIO W0465]USE39610.1 flagellar hook-length control protein FliK [Endozoicomonas sp. SCSIO W0465]
MEAVQHLSVSNLPMQGVLQPQASGDQHPLFHQIYQQIDVSGKKDALIDVPPAFSEPLMSLNREFDESSEPYGGQPFFTAGSYTPAVMNLNEVSDAGVVLSGIGLSVSAQMVLPGDDSVRVETVSQYQVSPEAAKLTDGRNERHRVITDISNQTMLPGNNSRSLPQTLSRDSESEPSSIDRKYFAGDWKTLTGNHGAALPDDAFIEAGQQQVFVNKVANPVRPEVHLLIDQVKGGDQASLNQNLVTGTEPVQGNQVSHAVKVNASAPGEFSAATTQQQFVVGSHREVMLPQSHFPQRLGTELIQILRKGESGLEIRLDPPELGRLSLTVSLDAESLSLQVTASSATTRDLLLNQSERLRQVLAEQHVDLSELSVDVHSGQGGQAGRHQAANMAASETLLQADWGSDNVEYLSGAQLFRSRGGRLLDHFV